MTRRRVEPQTNQHWSRRTDY